MGSGGVAIAALPTVICLKVSFSDGLVGGAGKIHSLKYHFQIIGYGYYYHPALFL